MFVVAAVTRPSDNASLEWSRKFVEGPTQKGGTVGERGSVPWCAPADLRLLRPPEKPSTASGRAARRATVSVQPCSGVGEHAVVDAADVEVGVGGVCGCRAPLWTRSSQVILLEFYNDQQQYMPAFEFTT